MAISMENATDISDQLNLQSYGITPKQLAIGMKVELEHGTEMPLTDVTHDDPLMTGKIAARHLIEDRDYYDKLSKIEGGKSHIQSVIFDKKKYTPEHALHFLTKNGIIPIKKMHETEHYYRYRIMGPKYFRKFRTVKAKSGVFMVIGFI